MMKEFALDFGSGKMIVKLPGENILDIVEGKVMEAISDVPLAMREALRHPIGSLSLANSVNEGDSVAIIASDITRLWTRQDLFLPVLLDELNAAGIPDGDILLVVALGAHRRHSDDENVLTYGLEVVKRVRIVQSYAPVTADFVYLGETSRGNAVQIYRPAVDADKVILTGGIAYHPMAGFSGGRKAVMPGVSAYASIQSNHRLCLHPEAGQGIHDGCTAGSLADNEMHQDMLEMAELLNPAFLLNAVHTPDGDFACFQAGHWREAWLAGCSAVEQIYGVEISGKADIALVSAGGFPKDINFYQASKAIENACSAVRPGGVLIALMECRDIAEPQDFSQWFGYSSLYEQEVALRQNFTVPGFVALKLGLIARQTAVIVVTLPQNRDFLERAGMIVAVSIEEALEIAVNRLGTEDYKITVMPQGASTMPVFGV